MELMARVVDAAIKCGVLREEELWQLSEREIIGRWDALLRKADEARRDFLRLYKTYRTMKKVRGSSAPLDGYFCVQLAVKRRWINPLVAQTEEIPRTNEAAPLSLANDSAAAHPSQESVSDASQKKVLRVCDVFPRAAKERDRFLAYNDTPYACVKLAKL